MPATDADKDDVRNQAIAIAAAKRAAAKMERLRAAGEVIHDDADFINREIEQAFLDIASQGQPRQTDITSCKTTQ